MSDRQEHVLVSLGLVLLAAVYFAAYSQFGMSAYVYLSCGFTATFGMVGLLAAALED